MAEDSEEVTYPEIYFDDPPEDAPVFPAPGKPSYTAKEVLYALEKLLSFVHNGRELKLLQLRMRGLSFREMARETHISHGAIVRFFLRVKKTSPEAGIFLEHTPIWAGKEKFWEESSSREGA